MTPMGNVRTEPLVGSIILMLVVGFFSQTTTSALIAVLITLVALAFGIQIARAVLKNSSQRIQNVESASRLRSVRTLASVVGVLSVLLFAYASYTLLAFAHYFSLAAIGVALCCGIVAFVSIHTATRPALQDQ